MLRKLRHQSALVGGGGGAVAGVAYGLTGGAGGRLRRSFRELDDANQAQLRARRRQRPPPPGLGEMSRRRAR